MALPRSTVPGSPDSRDLARWCTEQGWPVHPLVGKRPLRNCRRCATDRTHAGDLGGCPCLRSGGWCHGFHAATLDRARLERWDPGWGVGVACGAAGLVVLDIDAHPKPIPDRSRLVSGFAVPETVDLSGLRTGYHALAVLSAYRGRTSPADDTGTLRVRTPSGGLHVWYRLPAAGPALRCSVGSDTGRTFLAWQVDVRAHGGYIIAPGTRSSAGVYRPVPPATAPAVLPRWLLADLLRTGHGRGVETRSAKTWDGSARRLAVRPPHTGAAPGAGYLAKLLTEVSDCRSVPTGTGFSAKLNRAAWTAGGLVGGGLLDRSEARDLLVAAAEAARPQQRQRSLSIIDATLALGEQHPIHGKGRP